MTDPAHDSTLLELVDRKAALEKIRKHGTNTDTSNEVLLLYPTLCGVLTHSIDRLAAEIAKRLAQ